MKHCSRTGFTLVELLVVISIIGLLSSMATYYTNFARIRARDAKRKSDLQQIKLALDLYYDDYGHYPIQNIDSGFVQSVDNQPWIFDSGGEGALTDYIDPIPVDPINDAIPPQNPTSGQHAYLYYTNSDGSKYELVTLLEYLDDSQACKFQCYQYQIIPEGKSAPFYYCDNCGSEFGGRDLIYTVLHE